MFTVTSVQKASSFRFSHKLALWSRYSVATLPYISICDENAYDDLFEDLIIDLDSYDSGTFKDHVETFQSKYHCMGISCDQVGSLAAADENWPQCQVEEAAVSFAGYTPTSDTASRVSGFTQMRFVRTPSPDIFFHATCLRCPKLIST